LIFSTVRFPSHNTAQREVFTGRRRHTTLSPSSPPTTEELYAKLIEEKDKAILEKDKAILEKDKAMLEKDKLSRAQTRLARADTGRTLRRLFVQKQRPRLLGLDCRQCLQA
jgi:hypothetical protein